MPNFSLNTTDGTRILVGHIGRVPELKFTQSGKRVAKATLATNRKIDKNGNKEIITDWHTIQAWDESADALMQLRKGQVACIIGKESKREWQGKEYVDVVAWFVGTDVKSPSQGQHESLPPKQKSETDLSDVPF